MSRLPCFITILAVLSHSVLAADMSDPECKAQWLKSSAATSCSINQIKQQTKGVCDVLVYCMTSDGHELLGASRWTLASMSKLSNDEGKVVGGDIPNN